MDRLTWLSERRTLAERSYTANAPTYDEREPTSPVHAAFLARVVASVDVGGTILDAPCGTGRYMHGILRAGRRVAGIDLSAGMLDQARSRHPDVPVEQTSLQELAFRDAFDAAIYIDGMEYVPPEDWPVVLGNLKRAVGPGGLVYLTVEEVDRREVDRAYAEALEDGLPVVPGEHHRRGGGYHFYPTRDQVAAWLTAAGLDVVAEATSPGTNYAYWHLLVRRSEGTPSVEDQGTVPPARSPPLAKLDGDVAAGASTITCDRDLAAAGFPASGKIVIDFDTISYAGRSGVNFTGCSGVVNLHSSNQYVFKKDHEFLFAFGAGPVDFARPVYINGDIYIGQHTIYNGLNPVQVGLVDGYPFVREAFGSEKILTRSSALSSSTWQVLNGAYKVLSVSDYGVRVNGSKSSTLSVSATLTNFTIGIDKYFISIDSKISDTQIWGETYYSISAVVKLAGKTFNYNYSKGENPPVRINRTYSTSLQTADTSTYIKIYLTGNLASGTIRFFGDYNGGNTVVLSSTLTYKTAIKRYSDSPSLNVGQQGQTVNPSDLIASLLTKQGRAYNIDSSSFSTCKLWFASNGYSMAGFMDGGKGLEEVVHEHGHGGAAGEAEDELVEGSGLGIHVVLEHAVADRLSTMIIDRPSLISWRVIRGACCS